MRYNSNKIEYITKLFAKEDDHMSKLNNFIKSYTKQINISAYEGKILQILVLLSNAKKIVEIGTHCGYSALWLAKSLAKDGKIYSFEKNDDHIKIAQDVFRSACLEHVVEIVPGNAIDTLSSIEQYGPFDLVFIDANKISYPKYLDWAEINIRKGGLIIADNNLLYGMVYDEPPSDKSRVKLYNAMNIFNKRLSNEDKYYSITLPTDAGLSITIKK